MGFFAASAFPAKHTKPTATKANIQLFMEISKMYVKRNITELFNTRKVTEFLMPSSSDEK